MKEVAYKTNVRLMTVVIKQNELIINFDKSAKDYDTKNLLKERAGYQNQNISYSMCISKQTELNYVIKLFENLYNSKTENISNTRNRDLKEFSNKKLIAFTFDDGPSYIGTNKLLENLDKYNARVTFFVLGDRVNDYKDTLKRAHDMGNLIGSHTYSHSNLLKLDDYAVIKEIKKTNDAIRNVVNSETLYLRPPYGNINSNIKTISNMYTILWDLDTEDWKYKDANRIANYIVENAHDGAIVLLHDLYETSVDGALLAMEKLQNEGYAFVTVEEMATLKNVKLDKEKSYFSIK